MILFLVIIALIVISNFIYPSYRIGTAKRVGASEVIVTYTPTWMGKWKGKKTRDVQFIHYDRVFTFGGGFVWHNKETGERMGPGVLRVADQCIWKSDWEWWRNYPELKEPIDKRHDQL